MRRNPQYYSWECYDHRKRIEWIPFLMPTSTAPVSCSVPQVALDSFPVTLGTHYDMRRCQVSLTPTGLTPGFLSIEISRPLIIAR